MNNAVRLFGKDLGILIGPRDKDYFSQILIYQPVNSKIPNKKMTVEEMVECLPPINSNNHIHFLNSFFNRIEINGGIPIWRNPECFEMHSFNEHSYDGSYFGRGELLLHFRKNFLEDYEFAKYLVKKDIGFKID